MQALAEPKLLTISETARLLGVSKSWLYAAIGRGTIPAIELGAGQRRGRMLRVDARDLDAIIEHRPAHKSVAKPFTGRAAR
jgi:excisionase family DNA binding protein